MSTGNQESPHGEAEQQSVGGRPQWQRPEVTILDVENGTLTVNGPHSDGVGSTSSS